MAFSYIDGQIAQKLGVTGATKSAEFRLKLINWAAREIWLSADLKNALAEGQFMSPSSRYLSLPSTVGEIRSIRDSIGPVDLFNIPSRYHFGPGHFDSCRRFHIQGTSPLMFTEDIDLSQVTIELPEAEQDTFEVTVIGKGTTFNNRKSVIQVLAGQLSTTIATSYTSIKYLAKSTKTENDILVKDRNGVLLSVIPNDKLSVKYNIMLLGDLPPGSCACRATLFSTPCYAFDYLYKPKFEGFTGDPDEEFPADDYDDAIVQKALSNYKLDTATSVEDVQIAAAQAQKGDKMQNRATMDQAAGKRAHLDMGPDIWATDAGSGCHRFNTYGL